jgi:hypothetical protein
LSVYVKHKEKKITVEKYSNFECSNFKKNPILIFLRIKFDNGNLTRLLKIFFTENYPKFHNYKVF